MSKSIPLEDIQFTVVVDDNGDAEVRAKFVVYSIQVIPAYDSDVGKASLVRIKERLRDEIQKYISERMNVDET